MIPLACNTSLLSPWKLQNVFPDDVNHLSWLSHEVFHRRYIFQKKIANVQAVHICKTLFGQDVNALFKGHQIITGRYYRIYSLPRIKSPGAAHFIELIKMAEFT
jgi:hypothetical protein